MAQETSTVRHHSTISFSDCAVDTNIVQDPRCVEAKGLRIPKQLATCSFKETQSCSEQDQFPAYQAGTL